MERASQSEVGKSLEKRESKDCGLGFERGFHFLVFVSLIALCFFLHEVTNILGKSRGGGHSSS